MIITKEKPFTSDEIAKLQEVYEVYIKTVFDIEKRICSAGAEWHYENEKILLENGSKQENLWGGGIDLEMKEINYNSFINIRPQQKNTSNEVQDPAIREKMKDLTNYFFPDIL